MMITTSAKIEQIMDVAQLAQRHGGISQRAIRKAREYLRMLEVKCLAVDLAMPAACLFLACRNTDEQCSKLKLCSAVGVSNKQFLQCVQKALNIVGASSVVQASVSALCIRFGCSALSDQVDSVCLDYKDLTRRRLSAKQLEALDINNPIFIAAALFACSKRANIRVDKVKLLDVVCGNPKQFEAIVSSIESTCTKTLSKLPSNKVRRQQDDPPGESINLKVKHTPQRQASTLQRMLKKIEDQKSSPSTFCTVSISHLKERSISKASKNEYEQEYDDWRRLALAEMDSEDE